MESIGVKVSVIFIDEQLTPGLRNGGQCHLLHPVEGKRV